MWNDDGLVGVGCRGTPTDLLLDIENNKPQVCPNCSKKLSLHYEVWIDEIDDETTITPC